MSLPCILHTYFCHKQLVRMGREVNDGLVVLLRSDGAYMVSLQDTHSFNAI